MPSSDSLKAPPPDAGKKVQATARRKQNSVVALPVTGIPVVVLPVSPISVELPTSVINVTSGEVVKQHPSDKHCNCKEDFEQDFRPTHVLLEIVQRRMESTWLLAKTSLNRKSTETAGPCWQQNTNSYLSGLLRARF